jgi:hypothetical protein
MTTLDRLNLEHSHTALGVRPSRIEDAQTAQPADGADLRIALFCGIANWFLFLDHIPDNVASWITIRNYGFSGATDLFIFLSGYAAAAIYARMMSERGFIVGATRISSRTWQLYAAYVVLFVTYIVAIGYVAAQYATPDIINEFNLDGLFDHPLRTVIRGLLLQSRARNLDVLQLYIFLMAFFPPVLWVMLRKPGIAMIGSLALYCAARQFEWNLPSFPEGSWYFNPFCWQLLFVFGVWIALGGAGRYRSILDSPASIYLAAAFLIFALLMTMAGRFPAFEEVLPGWLLNAFNPNDKVNLAPYRVLHFIALALLVTRFLPKDWPGLRWRLFKPAIKCGQQSVAVFCAGVFLSFAGHFVLIVNSRSLLLQIIVSAAGIAIMTLVAYYISWSKQQDADISQKRV